MYAADVTFRAPAEGIFMQYMDEIRCYSEGQSGAHDF